MRLFIAIELPQEVRDHAARVQERVREVVPKASWTKADNLHVTLKFLGETRDQEVPPLCESLGKVGVGGEIRLAAAGVACFPERGPVRVITLAMDGSLDALRGLHQGIEQRCRFLGFEREQRTYRPHVTLARARPVLPAQVRDEAQSAAGELFPGPEFIVREFVLMASKLSPQGSQYTAAARFALSPDGAK